MHNLLLHSAAAAATLAACAAAQQGRFRDPVFPSVASQRDLAYGAAVNRFTQQTETLRLDLYEPQGDPSTLRPAVVIVHGGGFVGGDKRTGPFVQLGTDLAMRGYVAVSINYRLAPRGSTITRPVIIDAAHDMKAAVRWLRRGAQQLRIDTERIGCIGSSAGSITCLEAAYVPGDGSSGNPGFASDVHVVIDLWGFLADLNELDPGEAPVQIIHGTNDPVVPYSNGTDLKARADAVGVPAELHPIQGAGHAPWSAYFAQFHEQAVGFLYEHLRLGQVAGLAPRPGYASPGGLTFDSFGVAGDGYALFAATGSASIPFPDLGVLCLDPASDVVLATTAALSSSPRLGSAQWSIAVPPGFSGVTLYWQALHFDASRFRWLTNCSITTF